MGTQRTSNKDILAAIEAQTNAISGLVQALTQTQTQAPAVEAAPVPEREPQSPSNVQVDAGYKAHVMAKAQALSNKDNEDRILYVRKNMRGETKLAYVLASKWSSLRDNGLIGAIEHIKPE